MTVYVQLDGKWIYSTINKYICTNHPIIGRVQCHVTHFSILGPNDIFWMDEARHIKFGVFTDTEE